MNAPFKSDPVVPILADACVGISELKKNPAAVIAVAREQEVAILNRNKPVAYIVSPDVWEHLCDLVEDRRLVEQARDSLADQGPNVELSFDDL